MKSFIKESLSRLIVIILLALIILILTCCKSNDLNIIEVKYGDGSIDTIMTSSTPYLNEHGCITAGYHGVSLACQVRTYKVLIGEAH